MINNNPNNIISKYGRFDFDFDNNLRILNCDRGFCEISGYSSEDLLKGKMVLTDLISKEEYNSEKPSIVNQLEIDSTAFCKISIITREAQIVPIDAYLQLFIDAKNEHSIAKVLIIREQIADNTFIDKIIKQVPAGIGILGIDKHLEVKNANDEFYKILGFTDQNNFMIYNGEYLDGLIPDGEFESVKSEFLKEESGKDTFEILLKMSKGKFNEKAWILFKVKYLETINSCLYYQVHITDITMKKIMEEQLHMLAGNTQPFDEDELLFRYDIKKDRLIMPIKNTIGETRVDDFMSEKKWHSFVFKEDWRLFEEKCRKLSAYPLIGELNFRFNMNNKNGFEWCRMYYKSTLGPGNKVDKVSGRVINIMLEKEAKKRLEQQIKRDQVTNLLNKDYFIKEVNESLLNLKIKEANMLVIDIDNFSKLSENFGSMFADTVVQNIAVGINNIFRSKDIIGRISQDCFVVLVINVSRKIVLNRGNEVCNMVNNLYVGENNELMLSSSVGMASYQSGDSYETLFKRAFAAMHIVKISGKNCIKEYTDKMPETEIKFNDYNLEDYYKIENYDMDFLSFAFGLLMNSKDLDSSINLLLERICERYDLDYVVVSDNDTEIKAEIPRNIWNRNNGIIVPEFHYFCYDNIQGYIESFDEKGMLCLENTSKSPFYGDKLYESLKIKAFVNCAYYIDGALDGFVVFADCRKERKWSKYIKGTFYEMTRIIAVFVSLRKEKRNDTELIDELSTTDHLTGLYNLDAFKRKVKESLDEQHNLKKFVFTFTDINDFAFTNDNYGQEVGDKILIDFANTINIENSITCRVYSDYFLTFDVIESNDLYIKKLKKANDNFVEQQRKKYPLGGVKLSTGIFFFDINKYDIETAIDNANLARKKAKSDNEHFRIYDESLRLKRKNELRISSGLHDAIKNGEFKLYLQPKFSLDKKEIIGAEALVRWKKADGILHYPDEFIPIFEQMGQIVDVDFYIYEQVLIYMCKWQEEKEKFVPVSINFSRKNLRNDKFADDLCKLANFYGINYNMIEIEITESSFNTNKEKMLAALYKIQKLGFKISMDDFGTGYSSLNMLINAPIDVVKVDKSFMSNTEKSQKSRDYLKHLAGLIMAADKDIIFEGVETEEQADFLLKCGYKKAQGYLFEKAIDVKEFEEKYIYKILTTS